MGNMSSFGLGYVEGEIVLDFENLALRLASAKHDLRRLAMFNDGGLFGWNVLTISFHDDGYDCLFWQSGSVETQGESSSNSFGGKKGSGSWFLITGRSGNHKRGLKIFLIKVERLLILLDKRENSESSSNSFGGEKGRWKLVPYCKKMWEPEAWVRKIFLIKVSETSSYSVGQKRKLFESQRRCDRRRIIGRGLPVHATVTENVGYNSA
ncbi:hypothetical protein Tco_1157580 [Tanacetum coccineum]